MGNVSFGTDFAFAFGAMVTKHVADSYATAEPEELQVMLPLCLAQEWQVLAQKWHFNAFVARDLHQAEIINVESFFMYFSFSIIFRNLFGCL